jgi:hypothetical protein
MGTTRSATIEVAKDRWVPFLAEFTRENRGAHATVEVIGGEIGHAVDVANEPLDGVSADVRDGEHNIWIAFGSPPGGHHTHSIHGVTALRALPPAGRSGSVLEIEASDGTKTLLTLSRPAEYALPRSEGPVS